MAQGNVVKIVVQADDQASKKLAGIGGSMQKAAKIGAIALGGIGIAAGVATANAREKST